MYNMFRLGGDFLHMLSILILIYKIHAQKSCAGISLKTQILYAVVYVARYTDLLNSYISLYNSGMKLVFICSSVRRDAQPAPAPCARFPAENISIGDVSAALGEPPRHASSPAARCTALADRRSHRVSHVRSST